MEHSAYFSLTSSPQLSKLCFSEFKQKHNNRLEIIKPRRRRFQYFWVLNSVPDSQSSSSISDSGVTEPARILLERLFAQTQRLEEQIGRDPYSPHVAELGMNLGKLESDLHAALSALKKKEDDLLDAERKIFSEYEEISCAKEDLEQRQKEIIAARLKQEKLEEELRLANLDLASQATEIGDLKLHLKEKDEAILASQLALSVKEEEIVKMKQELAKNSEDSKYLESELRSKAKLLDEVNKVVEKQGVELLQLQRAIQKKEEELNISISMQKSEGKKLKIAEKKLKKQTMDYLLMQEELKGLAAESSKHIGKANEALEEFGKVTKLLSDVRSELVSTQHALASSRQTVDSQDELLEEQLNELEEQRRSVMSYMTSLRDAEVEMESERANLRVAEARNKELERDLSMEKELVSELQKELEKERSSLVQEIQEMSVLKDELERKSAAFEQTQTTLKSKESELVEARLEIQNLKSAQASLQLILEEKDLELSDAKRLLEEVNQQIAELKGILFIREDELLEMMSTLEEKDEHLHTMQHELSYTKLKRSEAEDVVEKIVDLTKDVVLSFSNEDTTAVDLLGQNEVSSPAALSDSGFKWQKKQLVAELEFTRANLKAKEMEIVAAQKALTIKDEELKTSLQRFEAREKEITELRGEIAQNKDELKQLYVLTQERIGEKTVGELAIEKLQLEAAQLEVEAATSALHKITEMSRKLVNKTGLSIDYDTYLSEAEAGLDVISQSGYSDEVKLEVSRLLSLTQQLVEEANR